ncbi:glycoside hydrolase family 3 N-terminal domain-containing protein [Microbacterium sp. LMC-P-041]|uniref:glycoside hydrolase family 3 protein n=1 Tax=Microbacterium sp. LMC-P-041 TaxID=3040293 RepID=UPI00255300D5|nr:glycoside hydrolase family 3 N-terminal domain-containing protein [Microbacterium sp. LMC-P-041]
MPIPRYPYQDSALSPEQRARDLVSRMTLEDKAGAMFRAIVAVGPVGRPSSAFSFPSLTSLVINHRITDLYVVGDADDAAGFVKWVNEAQELALGSTLPIPITFSSDPRHGFIENPGTAALSSMFSQWPESLGLAALRSSELVERYADIVRQEYVAVGLRGALHPQIDVATEPRWARAGATFGEDADLTAALGAAYIRGLRGGELGSHSVAAMAKHFPGGGPQKDGEDPHFVYGKEQVYPGDRFDYHLKPFRAAIDAGVAEIMPYYGMPIGTEYDEVGFAFEKAIVTGLLRQELSFNGTVCTDFGLLTDVEILGSDMPARAWGLESATRQERIARLIDAGVDQFGGEMCTEELVAAVRKGLVSETRVDESVVRLMTLKLHLGLFESPYADPKQAIRIAGSAEFRQEGETAQREAMTVLTNRSDPDGTPILPVTGGRRRVYVENLAVPPEQDWDIVEDPAAADLCILRLTSPFESRGVGFEAFFHAGSLEFPESEMERIVAVCEAAPTIVAITLDRATILGPLADHAAAIVVNYGASDAAVIDVLTGVVAPKGRLPFDLPSSMEAVEQSREDVPFDTEEPLFRYGHGLVYAEL